MTTARKAAPPKAQPKKVAPEVVSVPPVDDDDDTFDLVSVLEASGGPPKPFKFLGVRGHVLRDYTGEQVVAFSSAVAVRNFGVMLTIITDVGEELWAVIEPMHPKLAADILNKVVEMSGLHEGKLLAFSLPSTTGQAGTPLSQDSDASTD